VRGAGEEPLEPAHEAPEGGGASLDPEDARRPQGPAQVEAGQVEEHAATEGHHQEEQRIGDRRCEQDVTAERAESDQEQGVVVDEIE
jgi:hypothetical protein